jgi:hypothetical protein
MTYRRLRDVIVRGSEPIYSVVSSPVIPMTPKKYYVGWYNIKALVVDGMKIELSPPSVDTPRFDIEGKVVSDRPIDRPIDESIDVIVNDICDKMRDRLLYKSVERPTIKTKDKASDKTKDKASDKTKDKTKDKAKDKASDKTKDKTKDKASDKVRDKSRDVSTKKRRRTDYSFAGSIERYLLSMYDIKAPKNGAVIFTLHDFNEDTQFAKELVEYMYEESKQSIITSYITEHWENDVNYIAEVLDKHPEITRPIIVRTELKLIQSGSRTKVSVTSTDIAGINLVLSILGSTQLIRCKPNIVLRDEMSVELWKRLANLLIRYVPTPISSLIVADIPGQISIDVEEPPKTYIDIDVAPKVYMVPPPDWTKFDVTPMRPISPSFVMYPTKTSERTYLTHMHLFRHIWMENFEVLRDICDEEEFVEDYPMETMTYLGKNIFISLLPIEAIHRGRPPDVNIAKISYEGKITITADSLVVARLLYMRCIQLTILLRLKWPDVYKRALGPAAQG